MVLTWHCLVTPAIPRSYTTTERWQPVAVYWELAGSSLQAEPSCGWEVSGHISSVTCTEHPLLEEWHLAKSVFLRTCVSHEWELKYNFFLVKDCPFEA